jgi:phage-related protein
VYEIVFYEDKNGNSPIYEYIDELTRRTDKDSRINLKKIRDYMQILSIHGKTAGQPFMRQIDGDIWELRPIKNRIFFASWYNDSFMLLHHFQKKTQKTPKHEIEQAKRNLTDIRERNNQQ